jgi:hypothetical protein
MAMATGTTSANARVVPGGRSPTIRTERISMTTNQSTSSSGRILQLSTIDNVAGFLGRYGLVVVIGWIGALKFAHFEANQIQPLVAHSPFMGWLYDIFSVYTFSALLGVFKVTAAVLLAIKPWSPKARRGGQRAGGHPLSGHHQFPVHHSGNR